MFDKNASLLKIFVANLAYPAVLGSILYSVLSNTNQFQSSLEYISYILMMLSVIVFYSIDYVFVCIREKYEWTNFVSDIVLIWLMYFAFDSVNFFAGTPNVSQFYLLMGITISIFVVWDCFSRKDIGERFLKIILFEVVLAAAFYALFFFKVPPMWGALVTLIGSLYMIRTFSKFYSSIRETL